MIWTKKDLLNVLEQYSDEDVLVGELWTKLDVELNLADLFSDLKYGDRSGSKGVSKEALGRFNVEDFWSEYQDELDRNFDLSISENNQEMFYAIQKLTEKGAD